MAKLLIFLALIALAQGHIGNRWRLYMLPSWLPWSTPFHADHGAADYSTSSSSSSSSTTTDTTTLSSSNNASCVSLTTDCGNSIYRSYNGSCNNLQHLAWGVAQSPYGRFLPYNYGDGVSSFPLAKSGNPLPNARSISLALFPEQKHFNPIWNINAMQWGQIITHDLSLTLGVIETNATCCNSNGTLASDATTNPLCAPIPVPADDPIHKGSECLGFVRTTSSKDRNCTGTTVPAEPLSEVTSFMDLSIVYGSSDSQASVLRAGSGGRLLSVTRNNNEWPPQASNITQACASAQSSSEPCYLAGDIRVNQNPQLTLLQVVLLREHNRIADALAELNPNWTDEITFQETRRILIAEIQHINYYEWLPIFLGSENLINNRVIYPGVKGYVNDYDSSVNPSVLAEHATAAYRNFHTLIRGYLQLISQSRALVGSVRLSDWFNRPLVLELEDNFNQLARGLTVEEMGFSDQYNSDEITQYLFRGNNTYGNDLEATSIQRGRDHGLATYVTARAACNLSVPTTFDDLTDYISTQNVNVLKSLYESVEDLELVVAGSLEKLVTDTQAGPTFLCIMTRQFYHTRVGDRYFYENGATGTAFTLNQLESIREGASMARLLCDNVNEIKTIQPQAFRLVGKHNTLTSCDDLPSVDLSLWRSTAYST